MEHLNQSNVHINQVELLTMPTEILEWIFVHLSDKDVLTASRVCKRFATVAVTAFTKIHSNKIYHAEIYIDIDVKHQTVVLSRLDEKLPAIAFSAIVDEPIQELLNVVQKKMFQFKNI